MVEENQNGSIDKKGLLEFIALAHKNTYAAPRKIKQKHRCNKPILLGHKDYEFVRGEYVYHDSYCGSEWAPGREVVEFEAAPIWCMSYQGRTVEGLSSEFVDETFEFLKKALRNVDESMPFRGPERFDYEDYSYRFEMKGDWRYFTGRESVLYQGREVFFQDVMGSLVK